MIISYSVAMIQRTINMAITYWPLTLLFIGVGMTFREIHNGFQILRFLGLLA